MFVYVRQLLALCVLGCNQQHFLCGLLCSLIGVLANNRGREEKCFFSCFLCCSLASKLEMHRCGLEPRSELWRFTHQLHQTLYLLYICISLPLCVSQCPCIRACLCALQQALTRVPCWLQSALFTRLHVSRYRRFPQGPGTQAHTYTRTCKSQGHMHAPTHVHSPLSPSLSICLCSASCRFCFCGQQMGWHRLSLLNNKYTLCLSLCLWHVHLAVFAGSLRRNLLNYRAKIPNMRSYQPLKCEDLLLFSVLHIWKFNIFWFSDCWLDKIRHLDLE